MTTGWVLPTLRGVAVSVHGPRRARDEDLGVQRLPAFEWKDPLVGLGELYGWVEQCACEAIDWYMGEKKRKASWSRGLRALAAVLATLGGAIPVAALAASKPIYGNWGFVLLALAAGSLAYDRFFGYSSAWLRYMATAISLRAELSDFQLSWAKDMAALGGQNPEPEEVLRLIESAQSFVWKMNDSIRNETQSWLVEFNTNLSDLESRLHRTQSSSSTTESVLLEA